MMVLDNEYVGCWKSFCKQYEKKHVKFDKWLYCFSKYSPLRSIHFCIRSHFFHSKAVTSEMSVRNVSTTASGDVGLGTNCQLNYRLKTSNFTDMIVVERWRHWKY